MSLESASAATLQSRHVLIVVDAGVEFIHTVAVVADANVNSLDIANVTRNFHCGLHAKLVDKGGGLYRVWFLQIATEYAIDYPVENKRQLSTDFGVRRTSD